MKGERVLRLCRQRGSSRRQARHCAGGVDLPGGRLRLRRKRESSRQQTAHCAASPSPTDVRTTPTRRAELAMPGGKPRRAMPANPVPLALPPAPTACSPAAFACGDNLLSGLPITRYSEALILWCRR